MPEDLMATVVEADTIRRQIVGERISRYPGWKRTWIEPPFNVIGILIGQALAMLPWCVRWQADERIARALGGRDQEQPADLSEKCSSFAALAQRLHRQTGQWPATMVFLSHPLTTGPMEWLRFELIREGLALSNAVVEVAQKGLWRRAPQCFLAIDPYALDTLPAPIAGIYAGWMYRLYLAWDRMGRTQSLIQRWLLLRHSGYEYIAWRLLRRLKKLIPVVVVMPGGLPFNARLLYAAKEFVGHLPVKRWPISKRAAQQQWMKILMQPDQQTLPLLSGELPAVTIERLRRLLGDWGLAAEEQDTWLARFAEEFRQDAPYRRRLINLLFRQLVMKGRPFLWTAVAHRDQAPHIKISEPWAAYREPSGDLYLVRGVTGKAERITDLGEVAIAFSRSFVV